MKKEQKNQTKIIAQDLKYCDNCAFYFRSSGTCKKTFKNLDVITDPRCYNGSKRLALRQSSEILKRLQEKNY